MSLTTAQNAESEICNLWDELQCVARRSLDLAIRIGERLTQVKEELAHGEFLPWIDEKLPFCSASARNYMRLFREQKSLRGSNLDVTEAYYQLGMREEPRIILPPVAGRAGYVLCNTKPEPHVIKPGREEAEWTWAQFVEPYEMEPETDVEGNEVYEFDKIKTAIKADPSRGPVWWDQVFRRMRVSGDHLKEEAKAKGKKALLAEIEAAIRAWEPRAAEDFTALLDLALSNCRDDVVGVVAQACDLRGEDGPYKAFYEWSEGRDREQITMMTMRLLMGNSLYLSGGTEENQDWADWGCQARSK